MAYRGTVVEVQAEPQLSQLNADVTRLGSAARSALVDAVDALVDGNTVLAQAVLAGQPAILDAWRRVELCGQGLLAAGPQTKVALSVVLALDVGLDVLWVANHAGNIAQAHLLLLSSPQPCLPTADLLRVSRLFIGLLDRALEAFACQDRDQAVSVCDLSGPVETLHIEAFDLPPVVNPPARIRTECRLPLAHIVRELGRVGDRATDIAERVYSMSPSVDRDMLPQ
jgi:phosphate transport system protein